VRSAPSPGLPALTSAQRAGDSCSRPATPPTRSFLLRPASSSDSMSICASDTNPGVSAREAEPPRIASPLPGRPLAAGTPAHAVGVELRRVHDAAASKNEMASAPRCDVAMTAPRRRAPERRAQRGAFRGLARAHCR
jgi:hypothetical protein